MSLTHKKNLSHKIVKIVIQFFPTKTSISNYIYSLRDWLDTTPEYKYILLLKDTSTIKECVPTWS